MNQILKYNNLFLKQIIIFNMKFLPKENKIWKHTFLKKQKYNFSR